jgi:ribosomal protein L24E
MNNSNTCPHCGYEHQPGETIYHIEKDENGNSVRICINCKRQI